MEVELTDIEVMVEGEGLADVEIIRISQGATAREIVAAVARKGGFPAEGAILLLEDSDEPVDLAIVVTDEMAGKIHHVHRTKRIAVNVFYKHLDKEEHFPPSARVQRVLDWAVSKEAFNIDAAIAPDMELALHDEKMPDEQKKALPKNAHIGRYVRHHDRRLDLDLIRGKVPNGADDDAR